MSAPPRFSQKRIADPVHGPIGLSRVELDVIESPAFQRLRNVRQLGLAHYVFPGADYSRFAHSVGTCHLTGRILDRLRIGKQIEMGDDEVQRYRLAALLHDVGHYPFSHAMEVAVSDHYSKALLERKGRASENVVVRRLPTHYSHESLGKVVLESDPRLAQVLSSTGLKAKDISSIFMREGPLNLANLVSSDLDADRMDYLRRTAHHTGLPYGAIDIEYLLTQMRVDAEKRLCLTHKALRTAEHFLLGRYFDYQQVAFHKTVAGMELVLKDVLRELLDRVAIDCSPATLRERIKSGDWADFDDGMVLSKIQHAARKAKKGAFLLKLESILKRKPPRLVASHEFLGDRSKRDEFLLLRKRAQEHRVQWSKKLKIAAERIYIWDQAGMTLTKIGGRLPTSSADGSDEKAQEKFEQSVRILNDRTRSSESIMELRESIMQGLSEVALYALRVYVLFDDESDDGRAKAAKVIQDDLRA